MPGLYIACYILALCVQCALLCCKNVARKSPTNYVLLSIFTLAFTFIVGFICGFYDPTIVCTAALMTCVLTISLSAYAMFTDSDFTTLCGPFVCWGLILIFCISIACSLLSMLIFTYTATWYPFAAGFGVIVYGLFLLIDTQLVCGGGRHELSIDDYVIGALILYLDIVMIFLYIL